MRGISLWEPWASAIYYGLKQNETRHWSVDFRGPLAICAAKTTLHRDFIFHPLVAKYFQAKGVYRRTQLFPGKCVATAELVDCRPTENLDLTAMERAFGNYEPGRFAWILHNIRPLAKPFDFKGKQGFFPVPDELIEAAR